MKIMKRWKYSLIGIISITLAALAMLRSSALADDPCDIDPLQCTNISVLDPPPPFPPGSLALRWSSLKAFNNANMSDLYLSMTNSDFVMDVDGNISYGPTVSYETLNQAGTNLGWVMSYSVKNSQKNRVYQLLQTDALGYPGFGVALSSLWSGVGTNIEYSESITCTPPIQVTSQYFATVVDRSLALPLQNPPTSAPGTLSGCGGSFNYAGYSTYLKTAQQGYGWAPNTNYDTCIILEGTGRTEVRIEANGENGDTHCGSPPLVIKMSQMTSPKYRFSVYYPSGKALPTSQVNIVLGGFNP